MPSNRQTKKTAPAPAGPRIYYNGHDITAICVEADQKLGRATVIVHAPTEAGDWQPLTNVRSLANPQLYTVTITGPIEVKE